jgi:hypothetical protein
MQMAIDRFEPLALELRANLVDVDAGPRPGKFICAFERSQTVHGASPNHMGVVPTSYREKNVPFTQWLHGHPKNSRIDTAAARCDKSATA